MAGLSLGLGLGLQAIIGAAGGGDPPLAITGTPVTTGTDGAAYAGFTAAASGGTVPYTYSLVGTWPTGISINSSTGAVSGTPSQSGSFTGLSVRVTDAAAATADLSSFTLTVAAATDPYFASVVFLAGFEGADGATTYTEESSAARVATSVSGGQLDTTTKKFGSASLESGTGSAKFTFPDSDDWTFGTGEFTIEMWVYFASVTAGNGFIGQGGGTAGTRGFEFARVSSQLQFQYRNNAAATETVTQTGTWSPSTGVWYHIAVDKDASRVVRLYLDGTMIGSSTFTTSGMVNQAQVLSMPGITSAASSGLVGRMDEVRITKGVARYASNSGYTVPTKAFPRS